MSMKVFEDLLGREWYKVLASYVESSHFNQVGVALRKEREQYKIYPENSKHMFFAFRKTPFDKVRGVILGQDPYHDGSYDGLAFSNANSITASPSLRNILTEVNNDVYKGNNKDRLEDLSLYSWADQGILLINTALSVRAGQPESHMKLWTQFTENIISALNKKDDIVWMLWGRKAQSFVRYIKNKTHGIVATSHPSPLGAYNASPTPFMGSRCFSEFNQELSARNKKEIIW